MTTGKYEYERASIHSIPIERYIKELVEIRTQMMQVLGLEHYGWRCDVHGVGADCACVHAEQMLVRKVGG